MRTNVVSFKDAAKLKGWDAWDDHKGPVAWTEKRCVTREKLLAMDPQLPALGVLATGTSHKSDLWSVGCETLDRDYADWDQFKHFLPDLGVTKARFLSGWAKTEQEKGVYDFSWLDQQLRECAAMGVKPWVSICYGNPVWGSDFRLGMRVSRVVGDPAAREAWLRYTRTLVARYKDIVNEWEIWNEPFDQGEDYAEMVYITARAIREVQPDAIVMVTALAWWHDFKDVHAVFGRLQRENALDLVQRFATHPYDPNPDTVEECCYARLREVVHSYAPHMELVQGETGCPAQLEYAHALAEREWTEYAQAKWDLRRAINDNVRGIRSNLFTMVDLRYTFMLQSFGLIRMSLLKEPVYRRPSYFAMRNVYSLLDADAHPVGIRTQSVNGRTLTIAEYTKNGAPVYVLWYSDQIPGDSLVYDRIPASLLGEINEPTWCDLITGRVCRLDADSVPVWDSPVVVTTAANLPVG